MIDLRLVLSSVLVIVAACGDDGGSSGAPGPGTDVGDPTELGLGVTGEGTIAPGATLHFWTFLPPAAGDYVIHLGGGLHTQVDWCDQSVSAQGCACVLGPPDTCCDIVSGGACTVSMPGLAAGTPTSMVTWNRGPDQVNYTIRVAAQ